MIQAKFVTRLEAPWFEMPAVLVGSVPARIGTPDHHVLVESDSGPVLRVDLYGWEDDCFAFADACIWCEFLVIGWGHHLYLVQPETLAFQDLDLGTYYAHLYPAEQYLLVTSAERAFRIEADGTLGWQSDILGIDGEVVTGVVDGVVHCQGEWDPPGGWQASHLSLSTG